jgi:hypothetical protein
MCKAQGDVMSVLACTSTPRYAVILVRTEPVPERLVVAYRDEKSLRSLLAGPSILATGYSSREKAVADSYVETAPASPRTERVGLRGTVAHFLRDCVVGQWPSLRRFECAGTGTRIGQFLQNGVAVVLVLIYSKNLFSAMLRALVSF